MYNHIFRKFYLVFFSEFLLVLVILFFSFRCLEKLSKRINLNLFSWFVRLLVRNRSTQLCKLTLYLFQFCVQFEYYTRIMKEEKLAQIKETVENTEKNIS